ncbi:MAG: zf-HC2 domain-containing protein [Spirochaetales bacterium]|jgi:hypothetical protein|nr:zf-HC2 domain-containing protein [Spirochaetales bacterium]
MCPDKELLSAYCDGEVPSPWKERLDSHLENCTVCRRTIARYRTMGSILRDSAQPEPDIPAAFARIRERVFSAPRPPLWKKPVSLPLAAAAAAALIIFGGGMGLSFFTRSTPQASLLAGGGRAENIANIKDINQLREILEKEDPSREVRILLPDLQNFESRGKPVFLREADISSQQGGDFRSVSAGGDNK